MARAKSVKLSDIAEQAGVSAATVSNALSGNKGVSESIRTKIAGIAEQMGYQAKAKHAAHENKVFNIGVVIAERFLGRETSFYWTLYHELTQAAQRATCIIMFEVLSSDNEKNHVMPLFAREDQVDGVIILGQLDKQYIESMKRDISLPMLCLDFYLEDMHMDSVISENFYGMYQMTNYLIDRGHRKIFFVGTVLSNCSITDRYFGYKKALLENGIHEEESWVIPDRDMQSGTIDVKLPDDMPTAYVCNCDLTACDVVMALQDKGFRVPEDISVVGFDNFCYERYRDVDITTYEVNIKRMAKMSIERISHRIRHNELRPTKESLQIAMGHMIVKSSVQAIEV
ncbi:MAG: LacI family DNA-binding transcriptional regulator [Clostridiales Family XIII bacterium]|jgi:LacI family transcriptional regulator/LacI family purine nucleotide synthesis repressor|nr:LacI family DNA-binding transcriptional regulator [Clostridiales Family XIII bacterium]